MNNFNFDTKKSVFEPMKRFWFLLASLTVFSVTTGCGTSNGVSILARQATRNPIKPSEVRVYPTLRGVSEPWRIEGMISANILPLMKNTPENRVDLMKDTAANLGINSLVGIRSSVNRHFFLGHSNAILVNTGTLSEASVQVPKFIAFVPKVNFKIENNPSLEKLDDYIREYIRYFLTYSKGYYVYRYDPPGITNSDILQGSLEADLLTDPLGVIPDYALLCDVTGYDEAGNIVVSQVRSLKLAMILYDIKEKKIVWSSDTSASSEQSYVGSVFSLGGGLLGGLAKMRTPHEETLFLIRRAVREAITTLPEPSGFQAGPLNFMRGQLNEK